MMIRRRYKTGEITEDSLIKLSGDIMIDYYSSSALVDEFNELFEENDALRLDKKMLLKELQEIRDRITTYLKIEGYE